jgi:hypothetical protein
MENDNIDQDQNSQKDEMEETEETGNTQNWIQDNLRIVVSIIIVVVIAAGVYSYSKRSANNEAENKLGMTTSTSEEKTSPEEIANPDNVSATDQNNGSENAQKEQPAQVSSSAVSQETEGSFIETAGRGDGTTHLARRALANYLEKNSDSTLAPEHKIYIEDYLRKNAGVKGGVKVGTSVEFSKKMIEDAIGKSKNLNEKQLQNLHKYAVRVPSLS